MADGLLYRLITRGRLKLFRRPTMKTVLGAFGKCRRNYSLPTLEVAGSNPASAANYGRVAQRIERVKISLPLVARCTTPYGRMPAGLQIGYCGFDSRRRKRRKSCQSSRPPFSQYGRQMPWELHPSRVRVLPRFRRVAQSVRAIRRFQKTRCLPCCPLSTLSDDLKET